MPKVTERKFMMWSGIERGPVYIRTKLKEFHQELIYPDQAEHAERDGIKLLTLKDILGQLGENKAGELVLFDTLPTPSWSGNHWVIAYHDQEKATAKLAFSSTLGDHLYESVEPFEVSTDLPMFTGCSVQPLVFDGAVLSHYQLGYLLRVQGEEVLEKVRRPHEDIYWSESARSCFSDPENWRFITPAAL
jgi:hypothetical protein